MKMIIMALIAFSGVSALAQESSPGAQAFAALNTVSAEIKSGNFRLGCQHFGEYLAYKSMANANNTDRWTLRNLGFGTKSENIVTVFCSAPGDRISKDIAAGAADALSSNAGLE